MSTIIHRAFLGINYTVVLDAPGPHLADTYEAKVGTSTVFIEDRGHAVLMAAVGPTVVPTLHRFVNLASAMKAAVLATSAS